MPEQAIIVDSAIEIVTPENIAFRYELAGPFRRLPAFLIDVVIRVTAVFVIVFAAAFIGWGLTGGVGVAVALLGIFLLEWFYGGIFETYWNGQTPGKRVMGLRVLTVDGRPINGLQAVLRNVLRTVDMMPLVPPALLVPDSIEMGVIPTFLVGLAVATCSRRFQRMGDLVCGTIVVVEDRTWLFGISKIDDPRASQLAEYIPANFVVHRQLSRALATYLERRRFFSPARRREIASHIAKPLIEKFNLPRDTSYDLMVCAMYYRTFVAHRGDDTPLIMPPQDSPFRLPIGQRSGVVEAKSADFPPVKAESHAEPMQAFADTEGMTQ